MVVQTCLPCILNWRVSYNSNSQALPLTMGFPGGSDGKESAYNAGDLGLILGLGPWRRAWQPTPVFLGFSCGSAGKESAYNAGDLGSIPGLGRSPGEETGYSLQYSCLENPRDRGAWWAVVRGVTKSRTRLSNFHFLQ